MRAIADRLFGGSLTFTAASLLHPAVLVSVVTVGVLWLAIGHQERVERATYQTEAVQAVGRIAILLEQNVFRVANELDRIIGFIRQAHERSGFTTDWTSLIDNKFTVHDQVVLITIVDRDGIVVTSTLEPRPAKRLDLSDRDHFRFHVYASQDVLYISRPVVGRLSGKKTIQFTRRLTGRDGEFLGVVVASLDPTLFVQSLARIRPGDRGGFAVMGFDGTELAGTGSVAAMAAATPGAGAYQQDGGTIYLGENADGTFAAAVRAVTGYPLSVTVWSQDSATNNARAQEVRQRRVIGAALSCILLLGSCLMSAVLSRRRLEVGFLAHFDGLTGLANRAQFRDVLAKRLRASPRPLMALLLLDLDGFKRINDTYGHPVGDRLLIAVAERLRRNVRSSDLVARLSGDEFAILQLNVQDPAHAAALAARLCEVMAEPFAIDGVVAHIGASIGVEMVAADEMQVDELVGRADLALYAAKSAGKGAWRLYAQGMKEAALARIELEGDLRLAIGREEFELHYQPIVVIGSREVSGYEALIRWHHPTRGLVSPLDFIPLAEETKLIIQIGSWALHRACADMAARPRHLKIAVNISPVQFADGGLVDCIRSALTASGLEPERLEIEITESTLMQSNDRTMAMLTDIGGLGVKIAMDDFGTGYSSLSYLQKFPISCIKIDRSFVNDLGAEDGRGLVRAITSLAQCLGMTTIAEGVETIEQLRQLEALGCTEAQGFYFSKPMKAEEILPPAPAQAEALEAAA